MTREWPKCPKCSRLMFPVSTMLICDVCEGSDKPRKRWQTRRAYYRELFLTLFPQATLAVRRPNGNGGWLALYDIAGQEGLWEKGEEYTAAHWDGKRLDGETNNRVFAVSKHRLHMFSRVVYPVPMTKTEKIEFVDALLEVAEEQAVVILPGCRGVEIGDSGVVRGVNIAAALSAAVETLKSEKRNA